MPKPEDYAHQKRMDRIRRTMLELDWMLDEGNAVDDFRITKITIRKQPSGEKLVIVKAEKGGKQYVGFSSGLDASDALSSAFGRIRQKAESVFRIDTPYQPKVAE